MVAVACILGACILCAGCIAPGGDPAEPVSPTPIPSITPATGPSETPAGQTGGVVAGNTRFACDLYHALDNTSPSAGENIFFSPFSISTALAITYEGAEGATADEIRSVCSFPEDDAVRQNGFNTLISGLNSPDAAYTLRTANALWAEKTYPFLPAYIGTAEEWYGAEVRNMDFIGAPETSRQTINRWVEDQTEDRITDIIPQGLITSLTRLVITNAVYFKGDWVLPFNADDTIPAKFRTDGGTSVSVDMMQRIDSDARFSYGETDNLQFLRMPYERESGHPLSMLVFLPKGDDIAAAENALGTDALAGAVATMQTRQVKVFFPKFTFETTYSLTDTLRKMGMPLAFSTGADFSGMDGTGDLFISDVIHKAFVAVDEEGTEAAAATAVVMGGCAAPMPEEEVPVFRADHPFVFLIEDGETGTVLFMGRVADPTA